MSATMMLSELLQVAPTTLACGDRPVTGVSADSRQLHAGDVFIALAGASTHGLRYAAAADTAQVAAILFEPPAPPDAVLPRHAIAVPGLRQRQGELAGRFYGEPSRQLCVVGVTGTNGKTSTVQLLTQALSLDGAVAGSIGTLGAGLYGKVQTGERTTPDVIAVHRLLAELRDAGASHVAMEVSSHALDQGRVDGVAFTLAAFTNLTRDHLDYHGDMASYGAAKARLFAMPGLGAVVVNLDDAHAAAMLAQVGPEVRRIGVSAQGDVRAVLRAEHVALSPAGLQFMLCEGGESHAVQSPLLGRFNIDNLLAVAGCLRAMGWSLAKIAAMLPRLHPVPGRMTRAGGMAGQPLVVIDYAHTPDALAQALASLRAHTPGHLVCVFGCGGERDRGKRAQMAEIAEAQADRIVITDDNPRGEDGDAIVADILAGLRDAAAATVQRDRAQAITDAVCRAAAGDVVLVAGKGHEPYQEIAGRRIAFDDLAIAQAALQQRTAGHAPREAACGQ